MLEEVADAELVRRIAHASLARDAEAELCRRFAPRIRLYGLRHLRSEDRAADLVQGVLLVLLEAARTGRIAEPEHLARFVLGTCRNVALGVRKREARLTPSEPGELDVAVFLPRLEQVDVPALLSCMTKLDSRSRTVLLLSFHAESSADEIAAQLEVTAGNVRVLRHRALAQLRRCLDRGGAAA
ncbi:MAG TPA: sigma-70 family RNA polymerase sigma factor [Polyangiaceae bacterium]|jgi:RNA polymerase sigma-70 factor (ECF subfamily)|nr:sigma-70 family RNA polymerase sigma factor [Polyangiaceae bacterium]